MRTAQQNLKTSQEHTGISGVNSLTSRQDRELIAGIVHTIVKAVDPLKIILFGSMIRQSSVQANDMDLLVVVADGTPCHDTAKAIYRSLHNIPYPIDVVVATPELLDTHRDNIGLIYHTILKEGLEIYAP